MTRFYALVPCAGTGSRAGTPVPKQYSVLDGQVLVARTLAALGAVRQLHQILVVLAPEDELWSALRMSVPAHVIVRPCGGATRAASVLGGLYALRALGATDNDWVLVHDAARCMIRPALVERLMAAVQADAVGGLLALPVSDTLKQAVDGRVENTVDRAGKWMAQTPQMFRLALLERALRQAGVGVTDEASAVEALGLRPLLVPSAPDNFKLTYPEDFSLAAAILRGRPEPCDEHL